MMDGIHDLGGKEGFGPIDVREKEEPFHAAWEGRAFGLPLAIGSPPDWSDDWFRHCRELIDPADYLTRPYYDQWAQTISAMLVVSGIATVEELACGEGRHSISTLPPPMTPNEVGEAKRTVVHFDRDCASRPGFAEGDTVRARTFGASGHTRLPAYVRGCRGTITKYRGAHIFPDANAHGDETVEPLYCVAFDGSEIWPEERRGCCRVYLDLWESYLERK